MHLELLVQLWLRDSFADDNWLRARGQPEVHAPRRTEADPDVVGPPAPVPVIRLRPMVQCQSAVVGEDRPAGYSHLLNGSGVDWGRPHEVFPATAIWSSS